MDKLRGSTGGDTEVGEEECLAAMCGMLVRPVIVDKFRGFLEPYRQCLQHLKWLLDEYKRQTREAQQRLEAMHLYRFFLQDIFRAWRLRLQKHIMFANVLDIDLSDDDMFVESEEVVLSSDDWEWLESKQTTNLGNSQLNDSTQAEDEIIMNTGGGPGGILG